MSTIGVATAQDFTVRHREAGLGFVSAPVFGRPDAAAARQLFIISAGADEHLRVAVPLLEQLGHSVGIVGADLSQANLVKLIGNFMLSVIIETLGEACAVAGKAGIDPMRLIELLTSANFNSPPYKIYGALIASQRFQPAGFRCRSAERQPPDAGGRRRAWRSAAAREPRSRSLPCVAFARHWCRA